MSLSAAIVKSSPIGGFPSTPHYRFLDSNILTVLKVQPFFYRYNCRACLERDSPKMAYVRSGLGFSHLMLTPISIGEYLAGKSEKIIPELNRFKFEFIDLKKERDTEQKSLAFAVKDYLEGIIDMCGEVISDLGINIPKNKEIVDFDKNKIIDIVAKKTGICEARSRLEYEYFNQQYSMGSKPRIKGATSKKILKNGIFASSYISLQDWDRSRISFLSYFLSILFDELSSETNFPLSKNKKSSKTINFDGIIRDFTFIHQIILQCDLNNACCTLITNDKGLEYRANQIFRSFGIKAKAEGMAIKSYLSDILDSGSGEKIKRLVWDGSEWVSPSSKFRPCNGNEFVFTRKYFWSLR